MGMSLGARHYLVDRWFREECGRRASLTDLAERADQIERNGPYAVFNAIYTSPEAQKHRRSTGRKV